MIETWSQGPADACMPGGVLPPAQVADIGCGWEALLVGLMETVHRHPWELISLCWNIAVIE